MATFDPSAASRQLPFARGAMGLRESYAVAYVHRLVVGEGVLTLPLAVRREMAARCDGRVNLRFRRPRPKGGRGRPPLQLDLAGCEAYAAERIVTHDMSRRRAALCLRFPPSKGRVVEDADPYGWVGDGRLRSHPSPPPFLALRREGGWGHPPLQVPHNAEQSRPVWLPGGLRYLTADAKTRIVTGHSPAA